MFAVKSDFNLQPYAIPNLTGDNNFLSFVDDEEEKILKQILGIQLYNEFVAGLEEDYPEDKWLNLRDGAEYTYCNVTYEWKGLLTRNGAMVPYIYSQWVRANYDSPNTNGGFNISQSENSITISPALRISKAYNSFADMIGHKKLLDKHRNTLYGFLKANISDYSSLVFGEVGTVNIFDL